MSLKLDGETRIFLIIGDPIGQVKSPAFLSAILARRGENALVIPAHVSSCDLTAFMASVQLMRNLEGIIWTVPHKAAGLAYCNDITDRARYAGSCNVMRRLADDKWHGDNTDGQGYLDGIAAQGFLPVGKRALLAGAGGAGSAIAFEILERGASLLALHDIDTIRRDRLISRLLERFPGKVAIGDRDPRGFDLVANATPLGMKEGDPLPVDVGKFLPRQFVADVVTRPAVPPLIAAARAAGCKTMAGIGMFNAQSELLVDLLLGVEKP